MPNLLPALFFVKNKFLYFFEKQYFLISGILLISILSKAQSTDSLREVMTIALPPFLTEKPVIDGLLDEKCWLGKPAFATDFKMKWPTDQGLPTNKTEVWLAADGQFLFVAARCFDLDGKPVVNTLKRDVDFWDSDMFAVVLDPVGRRSNGFLFGVNVAGVQCEGLVDPTAEEADFNWDQVWFSETKTMSDAAGGPGWTTEMAIPLRSLRFGEGAVDWGINFIRGDVGSYEYSTWFPVPLNLNGHDLGYLGSLKWPEPPRRPSRNLVAIPYTSGSLSKDYEAGTDLKTKPNLGLDAKIGVTGSLNLDLTLNPDFSQIEADEQLTNLTRFDISLPEKRTFFLENADLFGSFGIPPVRPFFSRTIGLTPDGAQVPIIAGARLSGNVGAKNRIGLMNIQTGEKDSTAATNFTAATFHRQLLKRSNFKAMFLNREAVGLADGQRDFGRNLAGEFTFTNEKGTFLTWVTGNKSFQPGAKGNDNYHNVGFYYNNPRYDCLLDVVYSPKNFHTDMGFNFRLNNYDPDADEDVRIGYVQPYLEQNWTIIPKHGLVVNHGFSLKNLWVFNVLPNRFADVNANLGYSMNFKTTASVSANVDFNRVDALYRFGFAESSPGCTDLLPTGSYSFIAYKIAYNSDYRKVFSWSASADYGGFYNGKKLSAIAEIKLRFGSRGRIAFAYEDNWLDFPAPFCDTRLQNIVPRMEIFFSRNMNWTTFFQYNTQANNVNINSRLQWRFRPMSDLFFVFTDNYMATDFARKNRAVVLKVNYWLNL